MEISSKTQTRLGEKEMTTGRPKKEYRFISPNGETVDVLGLREFCEENSLQMGRMSAVYAGKLKSHKGWMSAEEKEIKGEKCIPMYIPIDAADMAKEAAKQKKMSVESYIGDVIELLAGGYVIPAVDDKTILRDGNMFTIHNKTPEDMETSKRIEWPFKDLEVGQTVEIDESHKELFQRARVAAHALAAHNGFKFATKTGENGSLYISRIK